MQVWIDENSKLSCSETTDADDLQTKNAVNNEGGLALRKCLLLMLKAKSVLSR